MVIDLSTIITAGISLGVCILIVALLIRGIHLTSGGNSNSTSTTKSTPTNTTNSNSDNNTQ